MSYSQSKQVSHMASLYESIYTESLNEEQQNQLLMVEWYNAMIKEGLIKGSLIENGIINENLNLSAKIGQAFTNLGPKVFPALRKITGFGLGPGVGGKRKALTVGAGTVTATDPQKAANQVSGAVTGTATGINRAVRAAAGQAVPAAKKEYQVNSFDSFDAIKGHLLDEGYADTEEAALKIMANMSEEWRESIVLDERNRGEQGMSDREVSRRRNLGGNTRSTVSSDALGDHGSQGAIQKFHNRKGKLRQAIHKSGRNTRGDTGESGGKGRYEANKDHTDGYPSITKRGQGPG